MTSVVAATGGDTAVVQTPASRTVSVRYSPDGRDGCQARKRRSTADGVGASTAARASHGVSCTGVRRGRHRKWPKHDNDRRRVCNGDYVAAATADNTLRGKKKRPFAFGLVNTARFRSGGVGVRTTFESRLSRRSFRIPVTVSTDSNCHILRSHGGHTQTHKIL